MQALRQIIEVKDHLLNIKLPIDFDAQKVEVIILPVESKQTNAIGVSNLRGRLNLTENQYKNFHEDVRNSREEWEKII